MTDTAFINGTVEFWQTRSKKPLSHEDGRQIAQNISGFFALLATWSVEAPTERGIDHGDTERLVDA